MRNRNRTVLAAAVAGLLIAALPSLSPAQTGYSAAEQACRSSVAKSGGKYTKTVLKTLSSCHKSRDKDGSLSGTDCNSVAAADSKDKLPGAKDKFSSSVVGKCVGVDPPSTVLYFQCPDPCNADVPLISNFAQVVDCEACLANHDSEDYSTEANGTPSSPNANDAEAACHKSILKNGSKLYSAVIKDVTKCQTDEEKAGATAIDDCINANFDTLTQPDYDKSLNAIQADCAAVTLPSGTLDNCGGGGVLTSFALAGCVCDAARDGARSDSKHYYDLSGPVTTTTTTTTTTTLPTQSAHCPDVGELTLFSKMSNEVCTTNADCTFPRTCNTSDSRCETVTNLDSGWKGIGHKADVNDDVTTRARLVCTGPGPNCGQCTVAGIDPEPRNCRCSNDTSIVCNQPFQSDAAECGSGNTCECYFGAPFPLNSAGTHVCIVNKFANDITGTANIDLGSGQVTANLHTRVYLGEDDAAPCPICGGKCSTKICSNNNAMACVTNGDCGTGNTCNLEGCTINSDCTGGGTCGAQDTPNDGIRDGICFNGGDNTGSPCDVQATNPSFPARHGLPAGSGGGGYSLDCQPKSSINVSGDGIIINLTQNTGANSLSAGVDCDGAQAGTDLCPCLVCTKDPQFPCSANSDCTFQGGRCHNEKTSNTIYTCNANTDCDNLNMGRCGTVIAHKCEFGFQNTCNINSDCNPASAGACEVSSCSSIGANGNNPVHPNACSDHICTSQDVDNLTGKCMNGPFNTYCDGLVRADGTGMKTCSSNADCQVNSVDNGLCSIHENFNCFLDPIKVTGSPDPVFPVAAANFCVPPVGSPGINGAVGLPGPGRVLSQGSAKTFCAGHHEIQYTPGAGNCP
ncbi:MAG TPA: hypothetical protein VGK20_06750 [Candidatus Binatia bacterium]|jgi:hypothetical protein